MTEASSQSASLRPLARLYFCLYAAVGVALPYLPAHYRALGLSGAEVGSLMALGPLATAILPPLWGYAADKTRRAGALLSLATAGSALAYAPLLGARTAGAIVPWLSLQAIFGSPVAMLADSIALEKVGGAGGRYSRVRLWGSVGFIAAALGFGFLWDGERTAPPVVVAAVVLLWALTFFASLGVRGSSAARPALHLSDAAALLRDRRVRLLLAATSLHWTALSPYNVLFTLHLKDLGLPPSVAGLGQAAGVAAEVAVMLWYPRLAARWDAPRLLQIAFLVSSVRWLLVGLSRSALPLVLVQVLHGLTFGAFMVTAVAYLAAVVPPRLRATGQAIYVCATYGIGGVLGAMGAGRLYDLWPARAIFFAAAALELAPALLAMALPRAAPVPAVEVRPESEAAL